ncbi:nucleotidyltransferase family protein [Helicobacter sp. MIT 05-5294]|uniref:D-glycero-D-manno-heptose 1-phosphate guanosyltransferase n=1 Tax=Helicobacter sp. MIT 05-5294 TaxID=1548150 RepID=UPI00051FE04E|nr:nucleotidyltransferase family protein [Helicobacter sp. MIT 05-5294]TLD88621.1 D-glycero-D-manno-heptose 1-phosphate guanosyltransferase [Helicobacter sp. MIT 05-5294]
MQAIVLCGGLGTRLREITKGIPKPMALINSKPFLEYILKYLKSQGITSVVLGVSYRYEMICEYFGDNFLDLEILYSIEKEPLGTGGAIRESLKLARESLVYVLNGDTYFDINLKSLELEKESKICLGLKKMQDFDRYGCVEIDKQGFIEAFKEKEFRKEGLINGGIYLTGKDLFDGFTLEEKFSFESFLQSHFVGLKASGKVFEDYFIDIGIPQDYLRAQEEME